jgi:hypothetical protein
MNKIKFGIVAFLVTLLTPASVGATLTAIPAAQIVPQNKLVNPGFENFTYGWTASGGATKTANSTAKGEGTYGYDWNSNGAAQTLLSTAYTIEPQLYGKNGLAYCGFKTPSGTATHTISVNDGSSDLVTAQTITTSSTQFVKMALNFIFPSSGSVKIKITSVNADEPEIYIDSCYLGEAYNLSQVSQGSLVASGYFPTTGSCTVTRANTALGAFGTTSACPGPTVETNNGPGTLQTTDVDLPTKFTINNLPPGTYTVGFNFPIFNGTSTRGAFAINDGTTTFGQMGTWVTAAGAPTTVIGNVTYTTTANRTFELYTSSASNTTSLDITASNQQVYFWVVRNPNSSQTAVTTDQSASIWTGYHDSTCSWARTNTALGDPTADTTCALTELKNINMGTVTSALSGSDKLPGIVFTPSKANSCYLVTASSVLQGATLAAMEAVGLTFDGGSTWAGGTVSFRNPVANHSVPFTLSGVVCPTTTSAVTAKLQTGASSGAVTIDQETTPVTQIITWSVVNISQAVPTPVMVGGLSTPSAGMEKIARTYVAVSGAASCAASVQSGTWVSSCAASSSIATLTIAAGTFSSTPVCTCSQSPRSSVAICVISPISATSVELALYNVSNTVLNGAGIGADVICMGPN